jgi:hypothetical protein
VTDASHDLGTYEPLQLQADAAGHARYAPVDAAVPGDLMRPDINVRRIMWTGTIWFAAAVGAVALVLGPLLSSGWRPALLTGGVRVLWWMGSAIVALSIGLIGWSGCPILEGDVPTANRNKSHTMQLGTMMFIVGSALALFAVLLGPPV